jgi:hypothetical protein
MYNVKKILNRILCEQEKRKFQLVHKPLYFILCMHENQEKY